MSQKKKTGRLRIDVREEDRKILAQLELSTGRRNQEIFSLLLNLYSEDLSARFRKGEFTNLPRTSL